jgi:GNAT superfamily N-acetyltransferase
VQKAEDIKQIPPLLRKDVMNTQLKTHFRPATRSDCPTLARLMQIAADGVCDYIWSLQQAEFPDLTLLEIGAKRYAEGEGNFSYRTCVMAFGDEDRGPTGKRSRAQGMMMAFAIPPADSAPSSAPDPEAVTPEMAVLAPYELEQPNSWYVCALAVFPAYRGQGIGTQFLDLAADQARSQGLPELSLLCFEQNVGAFKLYQRHGFQVIERTPVVPHPLIRHTGDLLLMTKPV